MTSLIKRLRHHNENKKTFKKYLIHTIFKRKEKNGKFIDFIIRNSDKSFEWAFISSNPNITMEIIESYPDKPWDWYEMSYNPNLTSEMIKAHPDKHWDLQWIVLNANPDTPRIKKKRKSKNQYLTIDLTTETINVFPDKQKDRYAISSNPGLTMEIIETHLDKPWDWDAISYHKFEKDNKLFDRKNKIIYNM